MPCFTHTREGTWGADQGRQYSKRRDRRWRLAGVDACPGGQAVHTVRGGVSGAKNSEDQSKGGA